MTPLPTPLATRRKALALTLAALALPAAAAPAATLLDVREATMRAPRDGFHATALSLVLEARAALRIVGAELPGARQVRLMHMQRDGSEVRMSPVPFLDLPAGQATALRTGEGGHYLMAWQLSPAPAPGRVLQLRLQVADEAGRVHRIGVPVRVLPARHGGHGGEDDVH